MTNLLRAISLAVRDQLRPSMVWLAIWPYLISAFVWGLTGWLFRHRAIGWLQDVFAAEGWFLHATDVLGRYGIADVLGLLAPFIYVVCVIALCAVTALLLLGRVAMPTIVRHVATRHHPSLLANGRGTTPRLLLREAGTLVVCVVGWVVTLPLWLLPPMALLLSLFWWGWLAARILSDEALARHASAAE